MPASRHDISTTSINFKPAVDTNAAVAPSNSRSTIQYYRKISYSTYRIPDATIALEGGLLN